MHDTDKLVSMQIRFDLIEWRDPAAVRSATVHRNECRLGLRRIDSWDVFVLSSHFRIVPHVSTASIAATISK